MEQGTSIERYALDMYERWEYDPVAFVDEGIGLEARRQDYPEDFITKQQDEFLTLAGLLLWAKMRHKEGRPLHESELTPKQLRYMRRHAKSVEEFRAKIGISLRAGQGPGKTTACAWLTMWFLLVHKNAIAPCIAPKAAQLQATLWKEVGVWMAQMNKYGSPLLRRKLIMQTDKIYHKEYEEKKESWAALMLTATQSSDVQEQGAKLRGLHAKYMLNIIEEASGLAEGVYAPLESGMEDHNFMVMIFNPIRNFGYTYDSHNKNSAEWITLKWSNEDCERISKEKIERLERTYGRESNYFRVNVLGEFPLEAEDVYIPQHLIHDAFGREIHYNNAAPLIIGVDPARFGKDRTAIVERRGHVVGPIRTFKNMDTVEIAKWLHVLHATYKAAAIVIDTGGLGAGVYDSARHFGLPVYSVNSATNARDAAKHHRTRDELLWLLRDPFYQGRIMFDLEADTDELRATQLKTEMMEEFMSIRWHLDNQGRVEFEKKDAQKSRIGRSPDILDAICLAYYFDDALFASYKQQVDAYEDEVASRKHISWMGS